MLTPEQIRGARAALGWPASKLAEASGLSRRTVQKIENEAEFAEVRLSSLMAAKAALEAAGIEFIGAPDDAPGIRIHKAKAADSP